MSSPFDVLKNHNFATEQTEKVQPATAPKRSAPATTPAADNTNAVSVTERKQISRQYVVEFAVRCKNFYWHEFKTDNGDQVAYWQCGFQVNGGYFNFHIFQRHETKRKDTFRAVMTVWKKWQSDGKTHIYVDLQPTERPLTHRLRVWQDPATMRETLPESVLAQAKVFKGQHENQGCFSLTKL